MGKNVGQTDKVIRIVVAIIAAIAAFMTGGTLGIVLWIVAAVMLVTGLVGFCPLYRLFGISTRSAEQG